MKKKVLIIGVTGQDGSFLAEKCLYQNYEVFGTGTRPSEDYLERPWLKNLFPRINYSVCSTEDEQKLFNLLKSEDFEIIYFLGSQSKIGLSWQIPIETIELNGLFIFKALNFLHKNGFKKRVVVALSGDAFKADDQINENSILLPDNPYAMGKAIATHAVRFFRDSCQMNVMGAILFMHESYRRPKTFFTQKIVNGVIDICRGDAKSLVLGNLNVKRDFISAIDVVEALFLLGETNRAPTDYIICGGSYFPLEKILEIVFSLKGLNFKDFVSYDQKLLRKKDKEFLWGDPTKIKKDLNWEPRYLFKDCLKEMLDFAEKLQ